MSSRFISRRPANRRRLVTSAVAFVSMGALAVGAAVLATDTLSTSDAEVELASTATCYDMVTVSIGGRTDTPTDQTKMLTLPNGTRLPAALADNFDSKWVDQIVDVPNNQVRPDSYAAVYVEYPADMASYENAVSTGVQNTQTVINAISTSCPNTRFAIVGYSEGADVTRRAAMEIGAQQAQSDGKYSIVDPNRVVGVVILADAGREEGEGAFPGSKSGTNPDNYNPKYQNGKDGSAGAGALPGTSGSFGALSGKVASFCSEGDLTCAMPANTSLLHLAANVGRQLNVDALERDKLTPATGADMATVIGGIALAAFTDIANQDNWLAGDETFLEVLIKVSEPGYKPADSATEVAATPKFDENGEPLPAEKAVGLAYLPSKIAKEIIGLIGSNTNTVPVLMNDPYGQTLGPGTGHHFDYWRDADSTNGKPLTSAQYAAAWLTQLAKDAEAGKPIQTAKVQDQARMAVLSETATQTPTSTTSATTSTTTPQIAAPYVVAPAPVVPFDPAAPVAPVVPVDPALPIDPASPVDGQLPVQDPAAAVAVTPGATTSVAPTTAAGPTTTVTPAP